MLQLRAGAKTICLFTQRLCIDGCRIIRAVLSLGFNAFKEVVRNICYRWVFRSAKPKCKRLFILSGVCCTTHADICMGSRYRKRSSQDYLLKTLIMVGVGSGSGLENSRDSSVSRALSKLVQ